ncbi:MAG: methylated-DNA--[protein]-cysteine S-methyltransferase [Alphaproteobacteria bacterium]|nr:methylated-DNA--[protein]-cysteine S-methyltransferase [Alphaproteobacteria bacterium]
MLIGLDEAERLLRLDFVLPGKNTQTAFREALEARLGHWRKAYGAATEFAEQTGAQAAGAGAIVRRLFAPRKAPWKLAVALHGTPFQTAVWKALAKIPHGQTVSYADIARRVGKPKAVRAVGTAVGSNPVSVIIPCHRVIGSDGGLHGFGWGLPMKRALLAAEGADCVKPDLFAKEAA